MIERIERLASEPLPRQALKMSGAERVYRIRVGDYRIIYELDHEAKSIMILHVRHRREAYRDL